jgi:hypothetical protein
VKTRALVVACLGSASFVALAAIVSCGGAPPAPPPPEGTKVAMADPSKWPKDDHSMCDWRNKKDLEVDETAGPGALKPNVRRVYKTFGEGDSRHKSIVCREIDTNLDGIKDVVRTFNAKGEPIHEEADSNFDGKLDVWVSFVNGRMSEEDIDSNYDGKVDVWKFYVDGELSRVKRDTNGDGKPDTWEIYVKGKLDRMGVDTEFDGHVDRWDRDVIAQRASDEAEMKTRAALAAASDAGAPDSGNSPDAGSVPKPKKAVRTKK